MTVVTPPDAAARVPVAKPSHSVRPGSFKWTWASTRPGSKSFEPWSTYVVEGGKEEGGSTSGTMEMILPVEGETDMVAGDKIRLSSGWVRTARVDTNTVKGSEEDKVVETVILTVVQAGETDKTVSIREMVWSLGKNGRIEESEEQPGLREPGPYQE